MVFSMLATADVCGGLSREEESIGGSSSPNRALMHASADAHSDISSYLCVCVCVCVRVCVRVCVCEQVDK